MRPIAFIEIRNRNYLLEQFSYDFYHIAALNGKLLSGLFGGNIHFATESTVDDHFLASLLSAKNKPIEGTVKITDSATGSAIRTIQIHEAYVCCYNERMYSYTTFAMKTRISLLVTRMDINSVEMDRRKSFYHGWVQCPPKPLKPVGTQNAYSPPVPLVKTVKGETKAIVDQIISYSVTSYNLSSISKNDRAKVKWKILIDDKEQDLPDKGEKIELKIKKDWENKEITIMPYLKQNILSVSVRTKVEDTKHYIVIPEKGTIKKDFSKTPQMNWYNINGRSASELTVQR